MNSSNDNIDPADASGTARPRRAVPKVELELLRAVRRIIRGYDLHSRRLLASSRVTLAQLLCLRLLMELGPRTARQLAEEIHLSPSTMVGILDRLEAKGLVVRRRDVADRRRAFVTITEAGEAVERESQPPLGDHLRRHLAELDPAQRASLAAAAAEVADLVQPSPARVG